MSCLHKKNNIFRSNKGTSIVFFALCLTIVAAFAALVIDIGVLVMEKAKLSSTIDSAVLAGAQELVANSVNAENVVNNYIADNAESLKSVQVSTDSSNRRIQVTGTKTIENYFAKLLGKDSEDISSNATAVVENIKSLSGTRPLAVVQQTFSYGALYTLKDGAGDGTSGNYAAIALGGSGGSNYRDNLLNGYSGTLSVGDMIPTETGNIAGTTQTAINSLIQQCNHTPLCTYQYYNVHCPRIIFIPIVNTLTVNGKKYVKVLGFGTFFLEGTVDSGGHTDVIGRFITYTARGEMSTDIGDYGTYGIKLIQ